MGSVDLEDFLRVKNKLSERSEKVEGSDTGSYDVGLLSVGRASGA